MAGKRINLWVSKDMGKKSRSIKDAKIKHKKIKDVKNPKKGPSVFQKRAAERLAKSKGPTKKQLADARKRAKNKKGLSRVTSPGAIKKEGRVARAKKKASLELAQDSPYFRRKLKQMENLGKTKAEKRGVKTYKPKAKKKSKAKSRKKVSGRYGGY
jgi:hypothetical protein